MKKLLIIILLIITGCSEKLSENYRGYIYNSKKEPLHNVKVHEWYNPVKYVYTDKNGYFLLKPRSLGFVDNLVFEKKGYITDSLVTVYYHKGHGTIYLFLTNQPDTLFMKEIKKMKSNGENTPKSGEIDLMKYYNDNSDYERQNSCK